MYERFTDRARKVMQLANQEARSLYHEYIGTEHLLLGLLKEGNGVAAHVLMNLGVDLGMARQMIAQISLAGSPQAWMPAKLPKTPRLKLALKFAMDEARRLRHHYVGTEHLLLGLVAEEGMASQVLFKLRLDLASVRAEILNLLGNAQETLPPPGKRDDDSDITLSHLPAHLRRQVQDLSARIDESNIQKEEAIEEADFELAADMRDTIHKLRKERGHVIQEAQKTLPHSLHEFEVYVPLDEVEPAKLEAIRQKIVGRFEGCLFSRHEVVGRFAVGPIVFESGQVGVFRFLADELEHAHDFLHLLQEQALIQLKLGPIAVIEKGVRVVI